ncbi:hypothetical protein LTS18_002075, partial [Coniosporium uncinatum]
EIAVRFTNRPNGTALTTIIEQKSWSTLRTQKSFPKRLFTPVHVDPKSNYVHTAEVDQNPRHQISFSLDESALHEFRKIFNRTEDSQLSEDTHTEGELYRPTNPIHPPHVRSKTPPGKPRWPGDISPEELRLQRRSLVQVIRDFLREPGIPDGQSSATGARRLRRRGANAPRRVGRAYWRPPRSGHLTNLRRHDQIRPPIERPAAPFQGGDQQVQQPLSGSDARRKKADNVLESASGPANTVECPVSCASAEGLDTNIDRSFPHTERSTAFFPTAVDGRAAFAGVAQNTTVEFEDHSSTLASVSAANEASTIANEPESHAIATASPLSNEQTNLHPTSILYRRNGYSSDSEVTHLTNTSTTPTTCARTCTRSVTFAPLPPQNLQTAKTKEHDPQSCRRSRSLSEPIPSAPPTQTPANLKVIRSAALPSLLSIAVAEGIATSFHLADDPDTEHPPRPIPLLAASRRPLTAPVPDSVRVVVESGNLQHSLDGAVCDTIPPSVAIGDRRSSPLARHDRSESSENACGGLAVCALVKWWFCRTGGEAHDGDWVGVRRHGLTVRPELVPEVGSVVMPRCGCDSCVGGRG